MNISLVVEIYIDCILLIIDIIYFVLAVINCWVAYGTKHCWRWHVHISFGLLDEIDHVAYLQGWLI